MKDISVIIPVFNCEKYIGQAIDSVLSQKDVDIELIVINDGSTDGTLNALKNYQSSIILYNISHAGASVARNLGISKATGNYIMFMDADDFLSDVFICRSCINLIENENLDMCIFSFHYMNNERKRHIKSKPYSKKLTNTFDASKLTCAMVAEGHFPASPCFRVLTKDFIKSNNLYFKEKIISEDIEWFIRVLMFTKRYGLLDQAAYTYRTALPNSVTYSMTFEKCESLLHTIEVSADHIGKASSESLKKALFSCIAYEYCILLGHYYHLPDKGMIKDRVYHLSWLLKYDMFPRIKYAKWFNQIAGMEILSCFFDFYIRHISKSKQ